MILDKFMLWADDLAHNGTVTELDLGAAEPGKGEPIECFIQGTSMAGVTAVVISSGSTSGSLTTTVTHAITAAEINAGPVRFYLPMDVGRYVSIALTGASAGTWTAGIVLGSTQTAR